MRVLVCIPCLLTGGTEIQTLSLVEALVEARHDVTVACYFEHDPGMVARFDKVGAHVELLSSEGARPSGVKATVTYLWKGMRRIIRSMRPEVAHVQYMAPGALPILILKMLGVKKIIATSHTDGDIYSSTGLRIIRMLTFSCLTAFQCITERAEKSYFGSSQLFDGTIRKHFTIYNNIPSHIDIRNSQRLHKDSNSLIYVGVVSRLEHIKGMDLVVPAFSKAAASNPRLRLLIAGDGTQRELMENQVREYNLFDRVEFTGRKAQSELQDTYDRIDILLMPSRSEGFGLTAIEGMARGCVPVVAATGGLPEVVASGYGILHRPEDADDLAYKIMEATDRLCELSNSAIIRAAEFSSGKYYKRIKELYSLLS